MSWKAINSIIYLDEMTPDRGQTHVVPGSHRWQNLPTGEEKSQPHEHEVAVEAAPGDAVFINSAIPAAAIRPKVFGRGSICITVTGG
ncbi:MAG: phytanoyl-CoA dioxygenase family protein [Planctomycetota bacterium]|nr:phytanoyl-CoA dioxygenase family protein [Planctomycetota bacterium]MDP7133709.1 phytanoyl-CoA dioxygenase family protein [Planctomycetota bacterium]